ncbi:MAG: hypothetical protein ACOZQL_39640 [Myxococcota bacterium]
MSISPDIRGCITIIERTVDTATSTAAARTIVAISEHNQAFLALKKLATEDELLDLLAEYEECTDSIVAAAARYQADPVGENEATMESLSRMRELSRRIQATAENLSSGSKTPR